MWLGGAGGASIAVTSPHPRRPLGWLLALPQKQVTTQSTDATTIYPLLFQIIMEETEIVGKHMHGGSGEMHSSS